MSQPSSHSSPNGKSLAAMILRETRSLRAVLERAFPAADAGDADPVEMLVETQEAVLRAVQGLKESVEALHLRIERLAAK